MFRQKESCNERGGWEGFFFESFVRKVTRLLIHSELLNKKNLVVFADDKVCLEGKAKRLLNKICVMFFFFIRIFIE